MKNKLVYIITVLLIHANFLQAQELRCNIIVNKDQLAASSTGGTLNTALFDDMKSQISDFMNNRKWTGLTFAPQERINCNIVINLKTVSPTSVTAIAQIQASRPVYGASYESVIINFIDANFDFDYVQSQPIDYSDNNYTNNLSSLLAFYSYIILAYDSDSFAKLGGTPFLDKAQTVLNNASGAASFIGWRSTDGVNSRGSLLENLISPQLLPVRESLYTYHRIALDDMQKDPEKARKVFMDIFQIWKKINVLKPGTILLRSLLQAKDSELIGIFSEASQADKQQVFDILKELDPTDIDKFQKGWKL